jgi:nicotinamidase-related amidase
MSDWRPTTLESYQAKGFARRSGFGKRPALLIVDFINGFTDPTSPLGSDLSSQLDATNQLLASLRRADLPVAYTVIEYEPGYRDAGIFIEKVPSLSVLVRGSKLCAIDDRIRPAPADYIVVKKYASAFFATHLHTYLRNHGIDTVVIVGCTTSGCVRASAVDALQHGYRTIVVREGCGDRADGPHEANLFDIDAKYGDVVALNECVSYVNGLSAYAKTRRA